MARTDQKAFYQSHYDTYGTSAGGVAWDSAQRQKRRFSAIASCLGDLKQDRLVDAGCGFCTPGDAQSDSFVCDAEDDTFNYLCLKLLDLLF